MQKQKQKSKRRLWPFVKESKDTISSMPLPPTANATELWMLYTTCDDTPLEIFMHCFCRRELQRLVKQGSPPIEILLLTWENLYKEFNELRSDDVYKENTDKVTEVNKLVLKIEFAKLVIQLFKNKFYSAEVNDMLRKIGIDIQLNPDDEKLFIKGLERVNTRLKKWMVDVEELHIEIANLQQGHVDDFNGYNFFYDTLQALSKFNGYGIKPSDVSVGQFIRMENHLKQANLKQQLNGNP